MSEHDYTSADPENVAALREAYWSDDLDMAGRADFEQQIRDAHGDYTAGAEEQIRRVRERG